MSPLEAGALILAGAGIGAYAGAIGAGGGFLITPLLLLRHGGASPATVATASLAVVAVSSTLSGGLGWRERRVDLPLVAAMSAAALPSALVGAALTSLVPRRAFAALIAVLLSLIAIYLAWRPRSMLVDPVRRGWRREVRTRVDRYVYRVPLLPGLGATSAAALIAALSGIGGGVFFAPIAARIIRMPYHLAVPAAHVVIAALSITVVTFHVLSGHAGGAPMQDAPWLALGVVAGAFPGQWLNRRLGEARLTRLLALGLLIVAARTGASVI